MRVVFNAYLHLWRAPRSESQGQKLRMAQMSLMSRYVHCTFAN